MGKLEDLDVAKFCTKCDAPLNPKKTVWLELDQRNWTYHDFLGGVPEEHSQGWFPFGSDCAKRLRAEARAALAKVQP